LNTPTEKLEFEEKYTNFLEIERARDLAFIGDLHGSFRAYTKSLKALNLVDEALNWKAGKTKLIFLGDILADRNMQGFQILEDIHRLRKQAQIHEGSIDLVAGNHDDYAISFLRDAPVPIRKIGSPPPLTLPFELFDDYSVLRLCSINYSGIGINEFIEFLPRKLINKESNIYYQLSKDKEELPNIFRPNQTYNKEVLKNMRKTKRGKILLEMMTTYNVCIKADDTLSHHTTLNDEMLRLIKLLGVDKINEIYQKILKKELLGQKIKISIEEYHLFEQIRVSFLSSINRAYPIDPEIAKSLNSLGINLGIHGHNPDGTTFYRIGDVLYSNIDTGVFQLFTDPDESFPRSVLKLKAKDASIEFGNPEGEIQEFELEDSRIIRLFTEKSILKTIIE
jgi:hypothetical protein